ncbi:hypothetical protein O181_000257 [Austropuccinia psidii MF-1]|uniref:Uncharacterized protein n=1 Tax=Austropuccinia psidii MF-1 TaxID=1389203 RepID=A0A9Q3GBV9_9BASI|nr:hypothetical protein [Austropuccinia psidii MF-1]
MVFLARTYRFPNGKLIHGAILLSLEDTLALRKVEGFASHSARIFCSHCNLPKSEIPNIHKATWPSKDFSLHHEWGQKLKDAKNKFLQLYDAKYTIFQTLPYWTNAPMMIIDVMHTVLLGMLRDFSITSLEIPEAAKLIDKKRKTLNEEGTSEKISFEESSQKILKRRERDELSESSGSQLKKRNL